MTTKDTDSAGDTWILPVDSRGARLLRAGPAPADRCRLVLEARFENPWSEGPHDLTISIRLHPGRRVTATPR